MNPGHVEVRDAVPLGFDGLELERLYTCHRHKHIRLIHCMRRRPGAEDC